MTDPNPYQSPSADLSAATDSNYAATRLYKFGHVGMATFFGSAIGGFVLMALNYKAFGKPDESRKAIYMGIAATAAIMIAAYFIPSSVPATPLNIVVVFAVMKFAESKQRVLFDEFIEHGAVLHSGWRAFGISLLCLFAVLLVIVTIIAIAFWIDPDLSI